MKRAIPLAALVLIPLISSCDAGRPAGHGAASKAELEAAAARRVFFGHQSVGRNILDGVEALEREAASSGPRIVEGRDASALGSPGIVHAGIGRNGDPSGKIRDFVAIVEGGIGQRADIALMKFCYADFTADTDVEAVFAEYRTALDRLASEYPRASFPMVTVPLTTLEGGPKALAKLLLGRRLNGREDNIAREAFNDLVRRARPDGEGVFDLARIESTAPDGSEERRSFKGRSFRVLRSEYSSDGSHLNAAGAALAAGGLISLLAAGRY